jgi:hypothetical protein
MPPSFNEKIVAYLTLASGISISAVAVYYSVVGLASIFSAAVVPIIIMGLALEISKLIASVWLKLNWKIAAIPVRMYLLVAIGVLMLITSIGIFGFLSRAHADQNLAGGALVEQLAIYDQKIQVSKDRIEINRKSLAQLDSAVDQTMSRSTNERGADKAILIRKNQAKERARLLSEIDAEQQSIDRFVEESLPLRSKLRSIEAEVGPIKYIAEFVYGNTDTKLLERAVTWMIITLIVVFDPLAVILLLAAQTSFQNFRDRKLQPTESTYTVDEEITQTSTDLEEPIRPEIAINLNNVELQEPVVETEPEKSILEQHPYLQKPFVHFTNLKPMVVKQQLKSGLFVQNEEQQESSLWSSVSTASNITQEQYLKAAQEYLKWR